MSISLIDLDNRLDNIGGGSDISLTNYSDASFGNIDLSGHIIPTIDASFDIGSADRQIRHLYVSNNTIYIGDITTLGVDNSGNLKLRKRKQEIIPSGLFTGLSSTINNTSDLLTNINSTLNTSFSSLKQVKLNKWKRYSDIKRRAENKRTIAIDEIFQPSNDNDWEEIKQVNSLLEEENDASFGNVDISGTLKVSGLLDMSANINMNYNKIIFSASDDTILPPDSGIIQKVQDLSNTITNNLINNYLDASFGNLDISGSIIPTSDNVFSLGSSTKSFKDVYIGPGSLYVNGKKVIEDDSNTMVFKTDVDQNLTIKTTGDSGLLKLQSGYNIILDPSGSLDILSNNLNFKDDITLDTITNNGAVNIDCKVNVNSDLYLQPTSINSYLYTGTNFTIDPVAHGDNTGKVIIKGQLEVQGDTTTINSTTLDICDNRIKLNAASTNDAGIDISFNDGSSKSFYYNKTNNQWKTDNTSLNVGTGNITANTFIGDGSQLTNVIINLTNYDDASLNNVDISGYLKIDGSNVAIEDNVNASLNSLTSSLAVTDNSVNSLTSSLAVTDNSVNSLTSSLAVTDNSVNTLTTSLNNLENNIDNSLATTDSSVNSLTTSLATTDNSVNTLTTSLNNLENNIDNSFALYSLTSDLYNKAELKSGNLDLSFQNLDVSGNLEVQGDATINGITIGDVYNSAPGWYGIRNANITNPGDGDFALVQDGTGHTVINASSGQQIDLQINNSSKLIVNSNGSTYISNLAIGNVDNSTLDTATVFVSHKNHLNSNSYALLQNNSGDTVINSATGRTLYLRIGDSTKAFLNPNYFFTGHVNVGQGWVGSVLFTNVSGYEQHSRIESYQTSNNWYMNFYTKNIFNMMMYTTSGANNTVGNTGRQVRTVHLYPSNDNAWNLGTTSLRWKKVYAASSSISTSDDRLKINETSINNSLGFIRNIDFYEYDKVNTLDGSDIDYKERGVIAQHLLGTDLEYMLEGGQEEDIEDTSGNITRQYVPYCIRYNDIFVTNCKATKELDSLVQAQQAEINLLKSKLNELLTESGRETI